MDSVREIAVTFCVVATLTAALGLLGGMRLQKSVRYILSLTLICSVVAVAPKQDFHFFIPNDPQSTVSYSTDRLYEYQAEALIADILKKENIQFKNITAKATKNEDGSIVINEIEISGCKLYEKAEEALKNIGIDCKIRVTQ